MRGSCQGGGQSDGVRCEWADAVSMSLKHRSSTWFVSKYCWEKHGKELVDYSATGQSLLHFTKGYLESPSYNYLIIFWAEDFFSFPVIFKVVLTQEMSAEQVLVLICGRQKCYLLLIQFHQSILRQSIIQFPQPKQNCNILLGLIFNACFGFTLMLCFRWAFFRLD